METLEELPCHVMEKSFHKNVLKVDMLMKEYGKNACLLLSCVKVPHKRAHMCRANELTEI